MSLLTKNTKPVNEYQVWIASDITNGDILGIYESLGNRLARTVTIESLGGGTTIRFNVSEKIYSTQAGNNDWVPYAGFYKRPYLINEIEHTWKPEIEIAANDIQTWSLDDEMEIRDIKIITKAPSLRITVT